MLSQETIAIVKATAPAVAAHAEEITSYFYPLMFREFPEVKAFFNQSHQNDGAQPRALANAVVAYAQNIENLEVLGSAVERIVNKHVSLGVTPEQYDIVGSCLLKAIKAVLGDAATDEVIAAWAEAYGFLAGLLIEAEEATYKANEEKTGGWRGTRQFRVIRKEAESSLITSFYLAPVDGGALPQFEAGQYTCVILNIKGEEIRRNYSLSDAPNQDYLRISVKREPHGVASGFLHDEVQIGDELPLLPPAGEFKLRTNDKPLVLVTGGVGITPAISMLNTSAHTGRAIHFLHAAINSEVHAFRGHVNGLAMQYPNVKPHYAYSQPTASCQADYEGLMNIEYLRERLAGQTDVELYLLGPKPFMQAIYQAAVALNIPKEQIHFEFFGPAEALTG